MQSIKQILSFIRDIPIETASSEKNPYLEIVWSRGKKMLNSKEANYSFGNDYKVFEQALVKFNQSFEKYNNVLILGFGCGSILHLLEKKYNYTANVVGIEYDSKIIELFNKHFQSDYSLIPELVIDDAQNYLKLTDIQFDVAFVDLFNDLENSPLLFDESFLLDLASKNDALIINTTVTKPEDSTQIANLMLQLSRKFKDVETFDFHDVNKVIIAR
jgi:spermidine synthase